MDLVDISKPSGDTNNMGGTKQRAWFAPISYFDTIAVPDPAATTLAGLVDIVDSHIFLAGKGFHKGYITQDKNGVNLEVQGETDGKSFVQTAKLFTPGSSSTLHGLASRTKNERFIVLLEETDTEIGQIGTADLHAELTMSFKSGEKSTDLRGFDIAVKSVSNYNYRYKGTITEYSVASAS